MYYRERAAVLRRLLDTSSLIETLEDISDLLLRKGNKMKDSLYLRETVVLNRYIRELEALYGSDPNNP